MFLVLGRELNFKTWKTVRTSDSVMDILTEKNHRAVLTYEI